MRWHSTIAGMALALIELVSPGVSFSQGLNLDSLIQLGWRQNLNVLVSKEETQVVAMDTVAARIRKNPEVDFQANYNVAEPSKPKASVWLSNEFQGGLRHYQYLVAKTHSDLSRQIEKEKKASLKFEITAAFYSWQILNQKKSLQKEVENRWQLLSRIATSKMKEGRLSQIDEAQAQLNYARAKQHEMEIQSEIMKTEIQLSFLTGSNLDSNQITPIRLDSLPEIAPLASLYELMKKQNPELGAIQKEIEVKQQQIDLEKALGRPPVTVALGYEKETDGNQLIGAGVRLPLQVFNRNQTGLAIAKGHLRVSEAQRRALETQIKTDIATLVHGLNQLALRYRNYEKEIRVLSRKQLDLSEKGFVQGLLGIFELSRVQEEFLAQELAALDILAAYYDQSNRLTKAVGVIAW